MGVLCGGVGGNFHEQSRSKEKKCLTRLIKKNFNKEMSEGKGERRDGQGTEGLASKEDPSLQGLKG